MSETKSQETVARLKELLFDRESRELDTLNSRLAEMQKRAGSDEQFQRTVAQVLDRAMRDAETSRHRELADAMAPMVVRTLRTEMKSPDMQDQIAGVMYPRMGEMVSRYVASAIRDMMQEINRRLESGLGHNRFVLWIRSIASGRSMAELALADTQRLEVDEIYLVRRGAGTLVHHWRRPGASGPADGANRDALVSGFLAATTSFAEEAFEADRESLRTLDLDGHRIYLRGSPDYLLAAKCAGSAPAGIETSLDAELIHVLAEHQHIERAALAAAADDPAVAARRDTLLGTFATRIEEAARERTREASRFHGMGTLKFIAALIGLPLLAFAAWYLYVSYETRDLQARVSGTIAGIEALKGYPVRAHVERGGQRIWITGLTPDDETRRLVLGRLKEVAPQAELTEAIGVLPRADVEARLGAEGFRRSLERAQAKLRALVTSLASARAQAVDEAEREALAASERAATVASAELGRLRPDAGQPRLDDRLARAIGDLKSAAERLAVVAGAAAGETVGQPRDATESAETVSLLTDRMSAMVTTIEQRRVVAPVARQVESVGESLAQRAAEMERRYQERFAEIERRLLDLRPSPPTARQQLESFIRSNAVFFSNESDYRTPEATAVVVGELARLITEAGLAVRVVGYTDEAGNAARNSPLAQARAEKVLNDLVARGAPRELLTAVGRLNGANIAPGIGPGSPNRRVELEIAFAGEKGGRP